MTTQHLMDSQYTGVRLVNHSLPYQSWFRGHILAWHETEVEAWKSIEQAKIVWKTIEQAKIMERR